MAILGAKSANIAPSWRYPAPSCRQDGLLEPSKSSSRGSPDRIQSHFGMKMVLLAVLADFCKFWTGAGCPKWRQDGRTWRQEGAKMTPRWPKMGLVWPTWHHFGEHFGPFLKSWGRKARYQKTIKNHWFLKLFGVLGGLVGGSWGVFWAILATSWAILGDLGVKLGTFRQDVVTKMAEDGLRWPT